MKLLERAAWAVAVLCLGAYALGFFVPSWSGSTRWCFQGFMGAALAAYVLGKINRMRAISAQLRDR